MKTCTKCKEDKEEESFGCLNGKRYPQCKECKNKGLSEWRAANHERVRDNEKQYREKNKDRVRALNKIRYYKDLDKSRKKARDAKWHKTEEKKAYMKEYRRLNKENISAQRKEYANKNKDKERATNKKWTKNNPDKVRRSSAKRLSNPIHRISASIRSGMINSLKSNGLSKNKRSWETLVGYTKHQLKEHLESQFLEGMSWDNYGKWHIDHIKPISLFSFSSTSDEEFLKCWSLENLQPLWALDNIKKGNKY